MDTTIEKREREEMATKLRNWATLFNAVGGIAGLSALAAVFLWGGRIDRQVSLDAARIDRIEVFGSTQLQAHTAAQAKEMNEIERRVTIVEAAVVKITDFSGDIKILNLKLDMFNKTLEALELQLKEHMKRNENGKVP